MNIPVSYKTLSRYIDGIPNPSDLSDILLTHICEVEGMENRGDDVIFDLKITPDRGDLLSYRGIAREVAIHSKTRLKDFAPKVTIGNVYVQDANLLIRNLFVDVREPKACLRYIGRVIEGVEGRESPEWLRDALEASGQRSINAIVDVTNFVMLELGQPMHAFDADKLARGAGGEIKIVVRNAHAEEKIETLDGKDIALPANTLVIADDARVLAIAGVKGGAYAGVGEKVNTIILEAATFDAALVRKTSGAVGIRTDSSRRFEHNRAPEIALVAMERATELLLEIFPDARAGYVVDVYPRVASPYLVSMASNDIARILGVPYSSDDFVRDLARLGFTYMRIQNSRERIIQRAKELVGTPYFYGASIRFDAPRKFDCSGLTSYLFLEAGIKIPRMAVDQYVFCEKVEPDNIKPGDLVFSNTKILNRKIDYESIDWMPGTLVPEGVDHVGIYLGDGEIIHGTESKGMVVIEDIKQSKQFQNIVGYRRPKEINEERFSIVVPVERFDIRIGADIAEEIARLISYEKIPTAPLSQDGFVATPNDAYSASLRARNALVSLGFSEIFTYAFRKEGKVELANPMAEGVNFLRDNLTLGMQEALMFNARNAPLLGVDEILMFEIGTVFFAPEKESLHISVGVAVTKGMKQSKREERERAILTAAHTALEEAFGRELSWVREVNGVCESPLPDYKSGQVEYEPLLPSSISAPYRKISIYPFMLRDIAMWATGDITKGEILSIIRAEGGNLLVYDRLFDVFEKDSRTSYAFNLVFQSQERTLSDIEINEVMARITEKLSARGLEVR